MQNQHILTERLRLRLFTAADFTNYYDIIKDPDNLPLAGQPIPQSTAQAQQFFQGALAQRTLAIELRQSQKVIGLIEQQPRFKGQPPVPDDTQIQIGYLLNRDYRRQGYMYEALKAALQSFAAAGYETVWAGVFLGNEPSKNLLRKLHFSYQHTIDVGLAALAYQQKEAYYSLEIKNLNSL